MSHNKFDEGRFGEEFDRLFEQSQYSKNKGGDDLEQLANLVPAEASARPADDVSLDAKTLEGFWTLFSENGGGGVPSLEAAAQRAQTIQRAESCHEPPSQIENEEYLAAWQGFRATALSVARLLRPAGGEALRYAQEIELESGPAHEKQIAPRVRSRSEAFPLVAYVAHRRRMYEDIQELIYEEPSLGSVLILLGLGVEACARLEEALRQIAQVQQK